MGKRDFTARMRQFQCLHHGMEWPTEKKINIRMNTGATRSILRRDLVEVQSNLVINQQERMMLRTATGESSITLGSVHMRVKLPASVIEGKFIVVDIYDECILGLDLMWKYGFIVDLRNGLLRAPHGDLPLLVMETVAVQQVHSEVDPMQELVKPCKEILSAEHIKSLKNTLPDYHYIFAQHDNDLGRTSLIQHQISTGNHPPTKQVPMRVPLAIREEMESMIESMKGPGIIESSSSTWS